MPLIPRTDLTVSPLILGGNVFGWTADEAGSFAVLDAFVAGGGTTIDTADSYTQWVPGNSGGESESVLGRWMASRRNRDALVITTKVGSWSGAPGLSAGSIRKGAEASLERLGTDRIDLYYAHKDDPSVPQAETLGAFDALVREGKVRHLGASNFSPGRLTSALDLAEREGLAPFVAVQDQYNLVERTGYESGVGPVVAARGLAELPYYGLASGFLTGKYRSPSSAGRGARASAYLDDRGLRVLAALDQVSAAHGVEPATVALAWLAARPGVVAPLASARTVAQLPALLALADLSLTPADLALLTTASA